MIFKDSMAIDAFELDEHLLMLFLKLTPLYSNLVPDESVDIFLAYLIFLKLSLYS